MLCLKVAKKVQSSGEYQSNFSPFYHILTIHLKAQPLYFELIPNRPLLYRIY
jgi:hypothetical protein